MPFLSICWVLHCAYSTIRETLNLLFFILLVVRGTYTYTIHTFFGWFLGLCILHFWHKKKMHNSIYFCRYKMNKVSLPYTFFFLNFLLWNLCWITQSLSNYIFIPSSCTSKLVLLFSNLFNSKLLLILLINVNFLFFCYIYTLNNYNHYFSITTTHNH